MVAFRSVIFTLVRQMGTAKLSKSASWLDRTSRKAMELKEANAILLELDQG
jgi:hypothetical protein